MQNSKLNQNKISSIFDLNIPRKINYNNSFNIATNDNSRKEFKTNCKKQKFRNVSKFNPYDIDYLQFNGKDNLNTTGTKRPKNNYSIYINNLDNQSENKENENGNSNMLKPKNNKYLSLNYKYSQNLLTKFNTPKIRKNLDNDKKETPEYLIKIKNQKNQYFTDLKNTLSNLKIKSTNYSSNGSYKYRENNYHVYNDDNKTNNKDLEIKESSFNQKINKINIQKSNKHFFQNALKTMGNYFKISTKSKSKSKEKKKKIRANKSENHIKISKNGKYISIGNNKSEKKDKENNDNIVIKKSNSFLKSVLYCCYCCDNEND